MTPYAIFAIALTIAYIIYYGYNISKDLYGKKGDVRDTAEEFDIASMSGEVIATPVREMDGGFSLGDMDEVYAVTPAPESEEIPSEKPDRYKDLGSQLEDADIQSEGGMFEFELTEYIAARYHNPSEMFRRSTISETRATL